MPDWTARRKKAIRAAGDPDKVLDPPVIVLTEEGYVTIRGPKHDIACFLRVSDGEIDYEIYPPGRAPPSGTDEEVLDLHQEAQEEIGLDGGTWETNNPRDIEGFSEEVFRETGTHVKIVVPGVT